MRLRLFAAVLLFCVSSPLLAQNVPADTPSPQTAPQANPPKPPPATSAITGTVFCDDTHLPARGAIVMAQRIPRSDQAEPDLGAGTSRVGMDGTYTIPHLVPGDYTVVAFFPGYISLFDGMRTDENFQNSNVDMRARLISNGVVSARNNQTARFDITIQRGATISGRILYDDGAPAAQAMVDVEDVNAKPSVKKAGTPGIGEADLSVSVDSVVRGMLLRQNQGTDDQGNFRIAGIKPGTYRIFATSPAMNPSNPADGLDLLLGGDFMKPGSLRIYSGDTFHKNAAKTYDLRAGDVVSDVDITIPVYAFHRVEGRVIGLDQVPIVSASISLTDNSDDSIVMQAHLSRDGEFIFPAVPSGSYKLVITGAKSGTVPEGYPDNFPVSQVPLRNPQTFADNTTTVLVKDDDVTDLSIQLAKTPQSPAQPAASAAAVTPSGPN